MKPRTAFVWILFSSLMGGIFYSDWYRMADGAFAATPQLHNGYIELGKEQSEAKLLAIMDQVPGLIPSVQEELKPYEVIIEYLLSDTLMLVFYVTKQTWNLYEKRLNRHFWEILNDYRMHLKLADIENLSQLSQSMYNFLISPLKEILKGKSRLIFVPGKDLSGIPFESFMVKRSASDKPDHAKQHYLIQDFEIVYHYSIRQWAFQNALPGFDHISQESGPDIEFAGFSPGFAGNHFVNALPDSRKELSLIANMFQDKGLSSRLILDEDSRKEVFKEIACNSRILHLATHSYTDLNNPEADGFLFWDYDPQYTGKVFSKGVLTLKDIHEMKLNADLIVLNTCASGALQKKEQQDLHSIPKGFIQAGARNILATLWNITDRQAEIFTVAFYQKWLSGRSYSQALREVKMDMINQRGTSLPTVWAPYVLIGR